jgi:excisionase family DNA binding protein
MPQYYTLEEAASKLQMSPDDLREMAKRKEVRAFQDRGSWRFRVQEIDELARERGLGSDPEVQMGEVARTAPHPAKGGAKSPPPDEDRISIDFSLESGGSGKSPKPGGKSGPRSPTPKTPKGDSDVRLVMDDSNLNFELDSDVRLDPSGSKSGKSGIGKKKTGDSGVRLTDNPSDSDVKMVPDAKSDSSGKSRPGKKSPSDSDIRLQDADQGKKKGGEANIATEEVIDLDAEAARLEQQKPAASGTRPRITQAANPAAAPSKSPFELSDSDLELKKPAKARADTDSSSDFELVAFDEKKKPKDTRDLGSGEIPVLRGDEDVSLGEVGGPGSGNSGINLRDPADSGISLEDSSSGEIELSLEPGTPPKKAKPGKPGKAAPPAKGKAKKPDVDSSSEFELSLDEGSKDPSSSEFELSLDDAPSDPSSSEFELSLDSSDAIGLPGEDSSASDSEFELTLDEEGGLANIDDEPGKDIFEPTNFDVPALEDESGSEAVAIDEATDLDDSDFEISLDEGGPGESQVVAPEGEEEADDAAATVARPRKGKAKGKAAAAIEEDEAALDLDLDESGGRRKKPAVVVEEDEEEEEAVAAAAEPTEWGALPAVLLFPTVIVLFLVGLMSYELVQGMFGYNRPDKVNAMLVDRIARIFDESLPK